MNSFVNDIQTKELIEKEQQEMKGDTITKGDVIKTLDSPHSAYRQLINGIYI